MKRSALLRMIGDIFSGFLANPSREDEAKFPTALLEEQLQSGISYVIYRALADFVARSGGGSGGKEKANDFFCLCRFSGGAGRAGLDDGAVQGCGAGFAAGLVHVRAMLDERLNGNGAAEADGVMQGGDTIFVRAVNVSALLERLKESSALGGRLRIALTADLEEGVCHSLLSIELTTKVQYRGARGIVRLGA